MFLRLGVVTEATGLLLVGAFTVLVGVLVLLNPLFLLLFGLNFLEGDSMVKGGVKVSVS